MLPNQPDSNPHDRHDDAPRAKPAADRIAWLEQLARGDEEVPDELLERAMAALLERLDD